MQKKLEISVVIVSRNRRKKLTQCLRALSKSSYSNFEVILVEQSSLPSPKKYIQYLNNILPSFTYLHSLQRGKSKGLNQAIKLAKSPIIAFTDDDCIVDRNWLQVIFSTFKQHPEISAMYGQTRPYRSDLHKDKFCPATFGEGKIAQVLKGTKLYRSCGYGNNSAFKKEWFLQSGGFIEWLGPGSIGGNAEDAEMSFRVLKLGGTVFFQPKALLFHNRWLTDFERNFQDLYYLCGEYACYGFNILRGDYTPLNYFKEEFFITFYKQPVEVLQLLFNRKKYFFTFSFWWILQLVWKTRGAVVALLYYKHDPPKIKYSKKYEE